LAELPPRIFFPNGHWISLATVLARTQVGRSSIGRLQINLCVLAFIRNGLDCSEEVAILVPVEGAVLSRGNSFVFFRRLKGYSFERRLVVLVIFVALSRLLKDAIGVNTT